MLYVEKLVTFPILPSSRIAFVHGPTPSPSDILHGGKGTWSLGPKPETDVVSSTYLGKTPCLQLWHTAHGRNPAPPGMMPIPLFIGFQPSQVVQDFIHQQYLDITFRIPSDTRFRQTPGPLRSCKWFFVFGGGEKTCRFLLLPRIAMSTTMRNSWPSQWQHNRKEDIERLSCRKHGMCHMGCTAVSPSWWRNKCVDWFIYVLGHAVIKTTWFLGRGCWTVLCFFTGHLTYQWPRRDAYVPRMVSQVRKVASKSEQVEDCQSHKHGFRHLGPTKKTAPPALRIYMTCSYRMLENENGFFGLSPSGCQGSWTWIFDPPTTDLLAPQKDPHPSPVIRVGMELGPRFWTHQNKEPRRMVPGPHLVPCSWWGSTLSIEPRKILRGAMSVRES